MEFTASDIGTSSKPIVIGSYGTGRAVISSGNSNGMYVDNSSGYKINNIIFNGSGVTANNGTGIFFHIDLMLLFCAIIKIDSVEVSGYHDAGISFGSTKNSGGFSEFFITNSIIHDNGRAGIPHMLLLKLIGFQIDPQFSDTITGTTFSDATQLSSLKRYKLKLSSALMIQGLNLSGMFGTSVGTRDFWGNSLSNKIMFNIGAYQLNTFATLTPSADTYIRNGIYASTNYGSDTSLIVKTYIFSTNSTHNSFLKFPLNGVADVVSAKLRVYGHNTEITSGINISIFKVDNDSWTQSTVTWNTAPVTGSF